VKLSLPDLRATTPYQPRKRGGFVQRGEEKQLVPRCQHYATRKVPIDDDETVYEGSEDAAWAETDCEWRRKAASLGWSASL